MGRIITIGREFGSGGRELGRRLADELGYAYYDSEILNEIAKETEYSKAYIEELSQGRPVPLFPIHYGSTWSPSNDPHFQNALDIAIASSSVAAQITSSRNSNHSASSSMLRSTPSSPDAKKEANRAKPLMIGRWSDASRGSIKNVVNITSSTPAENGARKRTTTS